jgi:nitroimidazol reductase NimA-like FMN-containing flavoprotein (pyridoxamine 5'-phosphate oxidase superfamily)
MHESREDLPELQRILDESYACAGENLRSIFSPEHRLSVEQVVRALQGVFVLHLATVTASGAPLVAPIDGLFYRGRVWFGVPPGAVRIQHIRARPQVSAVHSVGEELCIIVHGTAHEIDTKDPEHGAYLGYCREVYGATWDYWAERYRDRKGTGFTAWIEPRRMYAMATTPAFLA